MKEYIEGNICEKFTDYFEINVLSKARSYQTGFLFLRY